MQFPAEDLGFGYDEGAKGPRTPPRWTKDAGVAGAAAPTHPPNALVVGARVPHAWLTVLESSGDPAKICGVVSTLDVSEPGVWDGPDGDGRVARKGPRPGEGFDVDDTKKKSGGRHVVFSLIAGDWDGGKGAVEMAATLRAAAPAGRARPCACASCRRLCPTCHQLLTCHPTSGRCVRWTGTDVGARRSSTRARTRRPPRCWSDRIASSRGWGICDLGTADSTRVMGQRRGARGWAGRTGTIAAGAWTRCDAASASSGDRVGSSSGGASCGRGQIYFTSVDSSSMDFHS